MSVTASTENKTMFPTLISVNQATDNLNPLRMKIMKEFEWSRVAVIVHQSDIYMSVRFIWKWIHTYTCQ